MSNTYSVAELAKVHGHLELILRYTDGTVTHLDLGENVITTQGRSNMAHLLANDDVANRTVTQAKFGDAGHNPSTPTVPLPANPADVALFGATVITKTVTPSFPDGAGGSKVMFSCSISTEEGNGGGSQGYSEVGLYDVTGRMMTHKTFGLITKSNAFSITLQYTILF